MIPRLKTIGYSENDDSVNRVFLKNRNEGWFLENNRFIFRYAEAKNKKKCSAENQECRLGSQKRWWVWRFEFVVLDRATVSNHEVQEGNPVVKRLRVHLWEVMCVIIGQIRHNIVFKGPLQEGGRYPVFRKSRVRNWSLPTHLLNQFSTKLFLQSARTTVH